MTLESLDEDLRRNLPDLGLINFVTPSPDGKLIALGHAEGFTIVRDDTGEVLWTSRPGTARCMPAWSSDGQLLFGVLGDKKQIITFIGDTGTEVSLYSSISWPEAIAVDDETSVLAVLTDTASLDLVSVSSGEVLAAFPSPVTDRVHFSGDLLMTSYKDEVQSVYEVLRPLGYHEWDTAAATSTTNTLTGARLSEDGRRLLTFSTFGLEVWNVEKRQMLDFHSTDNQRIDAVTRAWWLPGTSDTIILQVPGALQRITLDAQGMISSVEDLDRVPGSNILDILPSGDWIVRQLDEDGGSEIERWTLGNSDAFKPEANWTGPLKVQGAKLVGDETIKVMGPDLTLTLPRPMQSIFLQFSPDRSRLYGAASDHTIDEWNFSELLDALEEDGF